MSSRIEADPRRLFADVIQDWAERQPDRAALISDTESFTYRALAMRIHRYARWARSVGITSGKTVCLMMSSRPDYVAAWLGISSVGGNVALINTKLVGASLAHCINVANADHVILAAELADIFEGARAQLARTPEIWMHGDASFEAALHAMDTLPLSLAERMRGESALPSPVFMDSLSLSPKVRLRSIGLVRRPAWSLLERPAPYTELLFCRTAGRGHNCQRDHATHSQADCPQADRSIARVCHRMRNVTGSVLMTDAGNTA